MTWRGTIGLVAVTAVLAASVWWSRRPGVAGGTAATAPLLAPAIVPTALDVHAAGQRHHAERARDGWTTESRALRSAEIPALLDALRTLSPLMIVDDAPATPSEFGLDRDALRLVVWDGETIALDLDVGGRNPAWTGVYVRRHGAQRVEMVGALLHWEIAKLLGQPATENALTRRLETGEPSGSRPAKEAP